MWRRWGWGGAIFFMVSWLIVPSAMAQLPQLPPLQIGLNGSESSGGLTVPLQILLLLTLLTFILCRSVRITLPRPATVSDRSMEVTR